MTAVMPPNSTFLRNDNRRRAAGRAAARAAAGEGLFEERLGTALRFRFRFDAILQHSKDGSIDVPHTTLPV